MAEARELLAVALDDEDDLRLLRLAELLAGDVGVFKIGLTAFVAHGPGLVTRLVALGRPVFLDIKLHDIPNTVAGALRAAVSTGAAIINMHASGGTEMMREGSVAARSAAHDLGRASPRLLGVTILTSLDAEALAAIGYAGDPRATVPRLARLAADAGLDGVVCSPEEIEPLRAAHGTGFLLVVPGIRPAGAEAGDQRRVATPFSAIRAGADLLVVGRPITTSPDPVGAARRIVDEIGEALAVRSGG